jgi:hypothetical protein
VIARLKTYLRRRKAARIQNKIKALRQLRMSITQREFALRGELAVLEASA